MDRRVLLDDEAVLPGPDGYLAVAATGKQLLTLLTSNVRPLPKVAFSCGGLAAAATGTMMSAASAVAATTVSRRMFIALVPPCGSVFVAYPIRAGQATGLLGRRARTFSGMIPAR